MHCAEIRVQRRRRVTAFAAAVPNGAARQNPRALACISPVCCAANRTLPALTPEQVSSLNLTLEIRCIGACSTMKATLSLASRV